MVMRKREGETKKREREGEKGTLGKRDIGGRGGERKA